MMNTSRSHTLEKCLQFDQILLSAELCQNLKPELFRPENLFLPKYLIYYMIVEKT